MSDEHPLFPGVAIRSLRSYLIGIDSAIDFLLYARKERDGEIDRPTHLQRYEECEVQIRDLVRQGVDRLVHPVTGTNPGQWSTRLCYRLSKLHSILHLIADPALDDHDLGSEIRTVRRLKDKLAETSRFVDSYDFSAVESTESETDVTRTRDGTPLGLELVVYLRRQPIYVAPVFDLPKELKRPEIIEAADARGWVDFATLESGQLPQHGFWGSCIGPQWKPWEQTLRELTSASGLHVRATEQGLKILATAGSVGHPQVAAPPLEGQPTKRGKREIPKDIEMAGRATKVSELIREQIEEDHGRSLADMLKTAGVRHETFNSSKTFKEARMEWDTLKSSRQVAKDLAKKRTPRKYDEFNSERESE